jgi:DNA-binding response OmpR family regulator
MLEHLTTANVLLIEDDNKLGLQIKRFLENNGFAVEWLTGGSMIGVDNKLNAFDIIICDIGLPDMSGLEICKRWREYFEGYFLFLTAYSDLETQLEGFELGADDYLIKPIQPQLLLARLNAKLRFNKSHVTHQSSSNLIAGIHFDSSNFQIEINDVVVKLTHQEFQILYLLANNINNTVSREVISKVILNKEYDGFDRTTDVYVVKLRKKFNAIPGNSFSIGTIWRKGYILSERDDGKAA